MKLTDEEVKKMWDDPSDDLMKNLTEAMFEDVFFQSNYIQPWLRKKSGWRTRITNKLVSLSEFCEKDGYWWDCLDNFLPTVCSIGIKKRIIERIDGSLTKVEKL